MNPRVMAALVQKDLRLFFTDRRAVLITVAAPLVMASFFGFIFSGDSGKRSAIHVQWVDLDHSAVSAKILANLSADETLAVAPVDADAAREAVRKGDVPVAVILPKGFGEKAGQAFFRGEDKPVVELLFDPSHGTELSMVRGILTQHVMSAVSANAFTTAATPDAVEKTLEDAKGLPEPERAKLKDLLTSIGTFYAPAPDAGVAPVARPGGLSMPYDVHEEALTSKTGEDYNAYAHSFAGMGVQFVFLAAIESAVAMLVERQRGLWRRLRAAPLSKGTVLGARAVSGTLIALFVLGILFTFGRVVFNIRIEGSLPGFLAVCLGIALTCATFGLLLATIGKTPQATRGAAVFVVLILTMLGGAWVPAFIFPPWLQTVTLVTPTRWAVDGLDGGTWRGLGLQAELVPAGVLLAFALVFGVLAVARFRWEDA